MRIPLLFAMAVLASGCGTSRVEALEKQVQDLSRQLVEVRKAHASVTVNVEDLESRLFLVQDELDTWRKRARRHENLPTVRVRPQTGPGSRFDPADTAPRRIGQGDDRVKGYDELTEDGRVIRSGGNAPPADKINKPASPPQQSPPPQLSRNEKDAIALYKASYSHYKNGRYQDAIDGFVQFVETWPNHGYADNAVYWTGECYYTRALWKKALLTFQQVIETYPMENKASDAMVKMGLCYVQLRDFPQAREVFNQVIEIYPNTSAAKLAASQLERIR